jgi:acyl-CoA reductase-like NAD-dependent aldehyde dehydrogenase
MNGGRIIKMDDTRVLAFSNPATGELFGQVPMSTPEDIRQAVCDLRAGFKPWSSKPVKERVRILGKLQEVLIDAADEITEVLNKDTGKSRQDALIELWMTVDLLKVYRSHAARWLRRQPVPRGYFFFKRCYFEQRPYGLVLVISPWNYPFYLSMPPVIAALLAGNTVILKPSEVTGASGLLMEEIFKRVPELAPYVRVMHGDGEVGAALVQAAPDYIFVTGSTLTGKKVMAAASENLVPVACELGGKDAVIILEDADIEKAARWTVWGAFFNSGQTCIAVSRVYVVESRYEEFVERAMHHRNLLKIGYSTELESSFYLGPMTDPRQLKIIDRHMQDALAKGAQVLAGGTLNGMFFEPVVMTNVDHSMLIMREETFGPILPIMKVKDEAEAIRMANDSNFGLGASIWSNNIPRAERVAHQVQAGAILVNDSVAQIAIPMLPFGGIKHSGYGRIHGKAGLLQFTQPYSYAVSNPPTPLDIGVVLREPGHYKTGYQLLHLLFGATLRQKLEPFLGKRK